MPASFTVRAAGIEDSSAYESSMSALFSENLDTLCPCAHLPTCEQVQTWIANHTGDSSIVLLALQAGRIVGTTNVSRLTRPHLDHAAGVGVNVQRCARGRGIGRSLLTAAVQWFQSPPHLERLERAVISNNIPTIHLYRSVGFSHEGVRHRAVKKEG